MGYSGKVEICGVNTAKLKVLKNDEMVELLRRTREGDMKAREEMISGNLRLVLSVIQRFSGRGENVDDLFQVGCIGLIKAIDNFDPGQNVRFSTYGVPIAFRSPKRKGQRIMTRKEALTEAIEIISKARIGARRKEDIIKGLELCQSELPFARWSEAAIFDACDDWVREHGIICLRDFDHAGLPSHPTIKNRFGMTAKEFRDRYYPISDVSTRSRYFERNRAEWDAMFVAEFNRLRATGQDDYNRRREKSLPTWNSMAAMHGVHTWRELLGILGLETHAKPRPTVIVRLLEPA